MDSLFVLGAFLVGAALSFFAAWHFLLKGKISKAEFDALNTAKQAADTNVDVLKIELKSEREKYESKLETVNGELQTSKQQVARLEAEKEGFAEKIQQHKQDLEQMEEKFRLQFENLANRIFDEKSSKFKKDSEEGLGLLLNPLKEKLQEFQKKVDDSFGDQAKEQFSLKNEIQRIVLANEKITVQAENLTNALKGESKTQGNWGEVILEKILDDSGLRKTIDYIVQGTNMDLKNPDGGRVRPDVVIMLPEEKHVIIDSKVSLTHYEQYFSERDEAQRAGHLKQFLSSVRSHVAGLEQRRYQDTEKLGTPDFVLMFIPIEGAYSLAIQQDTTLHSHAWDKKIVIVCPSTLFATLRTVASVWRIELQNRHAQEIARQGGGLYDKIVGFVEEMQDLGIKIGATQKVYDEALKKLSTGQGNVLKRTQDLKALGIKAAKKLPKELIGDNDQPVSAEAIEMVEKIEATN